MGNFSKNLMKNRARGTMEKNGASTFYYPGRVFDSFHKLLLTKKSHAQPKYNEGKNFVSQKIAKATLQTIMILPLCRS